MKRTSVVAAALLILTISSAAQQVQVSRTNKTIAVTADESVSVDPDLSIVTLGYHNYGLTEKDAYNENVRTADRLLKALLDAGLRKELFETGTLTVQRVDADDKEKWTPEERKQRQFEAKQSWKIKVPTAEAQKLVDLAMQSGANRLESVDWEVIDHIALQAKAGGAALAKARAIAEQMAQGLGAKLGELVYASNQAPVAVSLGVYQRVSRNVVLNTQAAVVSKNPSLTLFPQKVSERATVHAVFAIE